jgi:hypothetical protein
MAPYRAGDDPWRDQVWLLGRLTCPEAQRHHFQGTPPVEAYIVPLSIESTLDLPCLVGAFDVGHRTIYLREARRLSFIWLNFSAEALLVLCVLQDGQGLQPLRACPTQFGLETSWKV